MIIEQRRSLKDAKVGQAFEALHRLMISVILTHGLCLLQSRIPENLHINSCLEVAISRLKCSHHVPRLHHTSSQNSHPSSQTTGRSHGMRNGLKSRGRPVFFNASSSGSSEIQPNELTVISLGLPGRARQTRLLLLG